MNLQIQSHFRIRRLIAREQTLSYPVDFLIGCPITTPTSMPVELPSIFYYEIPGTNNEQLDTSYCVLIAF